MSVPVTIQELDLVVCGQVQYEYTVNQTSPSASATGLTLMDMLTTCCAKRATAVEHEVSTVSNALNKQSKMLEDVGKGMACCMAVVAAKPQSAGSSKHYPLETDDSVKVDETAGFNKLLEFRDAIKPYDLTFQHYREEAEGTKDEKTLYTDKIADRLDLAYYGDGGKRKGLRYYDAECMQSAIQLKLDQENNSMQSTSNTLSNFIQKRDDAYSLIDKLVNKINKTASSTVGAIGS